MSVERNGVALLVHKDLEILEKKVIVEGRAILAKIKYCTTIFNVLAIYAPNEASKRTHFWKQLTNSQQANTSTIILGDFNQVENTEVDRIPQGSKLTNAEVSSILHLFNKFELTDLGAGGSHTHKHNGGSSRIDRICVSLGIEKFFSKTNLALDISISDHLPILAEWKEKVSSAKRFILSNELIRMCDNEIMGAIEKISNDPSIPHSLL
jgi:exonuclease III